MQFNFYLFTDQYQLRPSKNYAVFKGDLIAATHYYRTTGHGLDLVPLKACDFVWLYSNEPEKKS